MVENENLMFFSFLGEQIETNIVSMLVRTFCFSYRTFALRVLRVFTYFFYILDLTFCFSLHHTTFAFFFIYFLKPHFVFLLTYIYFFVLITVKRSRVFLLFSYIYMNIYINFFLFVFTQLMQNVPTVRRICALVVLCSMLFFVVVVVDIFLLLLLLFF